MEFAFEGLWLLSCVAYSDRRLPLSLYLLYFRLFAHFFFIHLYFSEVDNEVQLWKADKALNLCFKVIFNSIWKELSSGNS